ncbi:MAG: hypothetical protein ACRD50_01245 [Candidatus Acidiferrales bacterium]
MKKISLLFAALLVSSVAVAHDQPAYERGKLLEMESVPCGTDENSGKSITGEIIGTDSGHKKTQEVLCQEYLLEGPHIVYRIRPTDAKHPVLLPVGEIAEFRIHKDKLVLRVPEGDDKEREYRVLSMKPREDADASNDRPKLSSHQ